MLAKKHRLPIQLFITKKGKIFKSPYFLLKIFPPKNSFSRFGVIISSKISKKAVVRNRLKRQIFDFFQKFRGRFPIADYLIIPFPGLAELNKSEFQKALTNIFNKVKSYEL